MTQSLAVSTMNGHDTQEQRYTVTAASALLDVSTTTIYDALNPNSTKAWDIQLRNIGKLNGRWLLPKSMLLAWNEARLANLGLSGETEEAHSLESQSSVETTLISHPLVTTTEQEVMGHIVKMIEERVRRQAETDVRYEQARNARLTDFLKSLRTLVDNFLIEEQNLEH